jgi:putative ABC transport system permease protein
VSSAFEGALQDLRFALRFLMRSKRSTSIAVLCLATGIAMTTATFSGVSAWVVRPLPWDDPNQLVGVSEVLRESSDVDAAVSGPNYQTWLREAAPASGRGPFSQMAAFVRTNFGLLADDEPERVMGARVSASTFPLFDEQPILGRGFTEKEDTLGRNAVVILGYELWQERFEGSSGVVGRSIRIDGRPHEIVGVMREGFEFPEWAQAWTPLGLPGDGADRDDREFEVVARLRDGVTLEQAQAQMDRISRSLEQRFPEANAGWQARLQLYRDRLVPSGIRFGLSIQLAASIFVLLIACANAANILLAQAASRQKELALRAALGATRQRIVRQLLTESTLIAFLSGGLGALASPSVTNAMLAVAPVRPPYWVNMSMDHWVLAFTVAVCSLTGIAFGLVPALRASRIDLVPVLKEGGRAATRSVRGGRLAQGLVAAELALAIVLLIGASLLIRSYLAMGEVDLGYDRDGVLTWRVTLPESRYPTEVSRSNFVREMVRRTAAIPGVEAAGAANFQLPAQQNYFLRAFEVEGQPVVAAERPSLIYHPVTDGLLETLRVDVLDGRGLRNDDVENGSDVVLVSEALAARFWPNQSALGRRIRLDVDEPWLRVVGVTRDLHRPLDVAGDNSAPDWQVFVPLTHHVYESVSFALRVWGEPEAFGAAVRQEFLAVDPSLPVYAMETMDQVLLQQTWVSRLWGAMFGGFAVFALLLSAVGLYGVISYGVAQRSHEVGVRMALGARPRDVLALVMKQGLWSTAVGAGSGLVLAMGLGFVLSSLLFGVETWDPLTFIGTTLLLSAVALLATFVPALRATRVDPVVALRSG